MDAIQGAPGVSDTYPDFAIPVTRYPQCSNAWNMRPESYRYDTAGMAYLNPPGKEQPVRASIGAGFDSSLDEENKEVPDDKNGIAVVSDAQRQKQSQVSETLKWLTENYERADGVCLPRCVLYSHYLDFCKKMKFTPAGAATFGKIIRQKFPKLTTRRLGTRGQSKYHYYGIGIKESSIYYHSVYSGKGLTRFSGIKIKTEGSNRKYSLSSKTGTLLPDFPDASNLILPIAVEKTKVNTFILMYRTHCQRILDTVISANFDEVQNFLLHFWQGMPEHLFDIVQADIIVDIIGLCDSILYKGLIDVLIPSTIQDIPDNLAGEIKLFIKRLCPWLENSLENVPEKLREKKIQVAQNFMQSIRRQLSFVHLAQTSRTVLQSHDCIGQMLQDISGVDFAEICYQAGFMSTLPPKHYRDNVIDFFEEFRSLLTKQASVESFTEWMDNIIDKCVIQPCKKNGRSFEEWSAEFLLHWAAVGSLVMRDLTLQSASSFGSFHLLRMTLDEYIFLVMETQQEGNRELILQRNVQKIMKNAEEIKMQARMKTSSCRSQLSPKSRRRRQQEEEEEVDSADESGLNHRAGESRSVVIETLSSDGTAFTRPIQSSIREPSMFFGDPPKGNVVHGPLQIYSPMGGASTYDRHSYLPQFGITSYSDYVNFSSSASYNTGRVQNYGEAQNYGVPSAAGSYWTDVSDPYVSYGYNTFPAPYDAYSKTPALRNTTYRETLNRGTFELSRNLYSRGHDAFQVGNPLSVSSYGGNFMEIAQPAAQYNRSEGAVIYQDDIYPGNMSSSVTSLGKSYIATPYR